MSKEIMKVLNKTFREGLIEDLLGVTRDYLADRLVHFGDVRYADTYILEFKRGRYESTISIGSLSGLDYQLDIEIYDAISYEDIERITIPLSIKETENGEFYITEAKLANIVQKIMTTLDSCDNLN